MNGYALPALDVIANPVIFRIWVHKSSLKNWVNLGKAPIQESLGKQVPRFKQDLLSGKLSIYINAQEEPASFEEIQGLECAAVWESPHILSRLNDHFSGNKNAWVAAMQPKKKG